MRELKLLVVHRDDLVDERRRCQQRLRWHLHQLDPTLAVPAGALDRQVQLERVGRWLQRREQTLQVRIARDLVGRCRTLSRTINDLERELAAEATRIAPALLQLPGCGRLTAAKLLCEIGPIDRFRTDAQLARHGGVAPLEASSGKTRRHRLDHGGNRQLNCALHRIAVTQSRVHPPARAYLDRKQNEGKSRREAIRCLKRQLARVVFNTLKASPTLTYRRRSRSTRPRGSELVLRTVLGSSLRWLARREQELQVRLARDLVAIIRQLNKTIGELEQELEARTNALAPALLELPGCATLTAAKLLAEIGPVDRFRSDAQLARDGGVAPLEASSGRSQRHRLDRGGNCQLNAALYRIAITQARYYAPARAYLERKRSEGKSRHEALRCLKRLLARVVFNTLKATPALR